MDVMTKEESYAERRKLFKNIWETAMQIDGKNIMAKPKVIKTLRMDDMDKFVIGKKKKERIKNLRTVCNKILDFCDRQDADDMFYEQVAEGKEPLRHKLALKRRRIKTHRGRKKIKKAKSLFVPETTEGDQAKATMSETKDDFRHYTKNRYRKTTLPKRTTVVLRTIVRHRTSNPDNAEAMGKGSVNRRKLVRKKRSKRKKVSVPNETSTRPAGASNDFQVSGRSIVRRIKQLLTGNQIIVTEKKDNQLIISASSSSLVDKTISIA